MRKLISCAALCVALATPAAAAVPVGDWPCVQVRVESLSVATFWSGPPVDEQAAKAWRDRPEIADVVSRLVSRRVEIEDAEKLVAEYAGSHKDDKDRMALVFAGAFAELNTLRTQIVHGIERFSRNMRKLSEDLNKARAELSTLTALPEKNEQQRARIQELQTRVQWDTRLHNERQATLRYVCETPVLLEQRIFAIARAVQNEM